MYEYPQIEKARVFALAAHAGIGQLRKYNNERYTVHTERVAFLVWGPGRMLPAIVAHLHDVIEDTKVTYEILVEEFGVSVADVVMQVSKVSKPEGGNRKRRNKLDFEHFARGGYEAQTVKFADIIDNLTDIVAQDPGYAVKYKAEKRQLLSMMHGGDRALWQRAWNLAQE
jgi:(p)ppGpp synthase/HD superfamily hydrolase